ncbi:hypothetical protein F4604DRAFT_2044509 [Suillus subluteus]|nr:hypothetical protein F4604DRAFT_2044509 [Suillus subluteus]
MFLHCAIQIPKNPHFKFKSLVTCPADVPLELLETAVSRSQLIHYLEYNLTLILLLSRRRIKYYFNSSPNRRPAVEHIKWHNSHLSSPSITACGSTATSTAPSHSDTVPMTLQDLDHIKNLVLDILGWGVSPEYLVDRLTLPCSLYLCRVSRSKDGSANVNGHGKSIWDNFSKQPGQALAQQNETIPDSIDVESLMTGGDDDKVYRALGVPKTIGTVHGLSPSCSFNASDTIVQVQEVIIPIIRFTLENKLIDLFDNMYDLIDALTFRLHAISPNFFDPILAQAQEENSPCTRVFNAAVIAQSPPSIRQTGNLIDADIELCSIQVQALSLLSLVELLTLFEDKGVAIQNVATSDRHVKMEEMIEQLASLLLLIEALLTHPDYSPHLAASLELTGLFRNMWFLCVLFYLTSVPRASSPLDEHVDAGANVWADNVSTSPAPAPASVLALEFDPLDNRPAASKAAEINSRPRGASVSSAHAFGPGTSRG